MRLEILPVLGIGDITEGDDLAMLIGTAAPWLHDGDVLVVTSKIVSKAEGRLVDVPADGPDREAARNEILAAETARTVARRGPTRIVQTHHGFVMASAGIDASNVDKTRLVLLPVDPDASARRLRQALLERFGVDVAVIVSDTMGRPWRNGLTDVALGVAGMPAIRDHRGEIDPYGNELQITQMAVVDELAGAGDLIKGKRDQVPVAVVRGYLNPARPDPTGTDRSAPVADGPGARVLVRDAEQDLFSLGTAEARAAGLLAAATLDESLAGEPVDPELVHRAIDAIRDQIAPGTLFTLVQGEPTDGEPTNDEPTNDEPAGTSQSAGASQPGRPVEWPAGATRIVLGQPPAGPVGPTELVRLGADLHRLRAALAAVGVPSVLFPPPTDSGAAGALAL